MVDSKALLSSHLMRFQFVQISAVQGNTRPVNGRPHQGDRMPNGYGGQQGTSQFLLTVVPIDTDFNWLSILLVMFSFIPHEGCDELGPNPIDPRIPGPRLPVPWTKDPHKSDRPGQIVPNKFGPQGQMVPRSLIPMDIWSPTNSILVFPDPHSLPSWTNGIFQGPFVQGDQISWGMELVGISNMFKHQIFNFFIHAFSDRILPRRETAATG